MVYAEVATPNFKVVWYDTSIIPKGKNNMKPIKWEVYVNSANASVGGVRLSVYSHVTKSNKTKWMALVYYPYISRITEMIDGPIRKTIEEAQEDAIRLAREFLLNMQTCLNIELANFGLEPGDEE